MSVWRSLPFDGLGWGRCADRDVGRCRHWASARWYDRFPVVLRPVLFCANRIAWAIAALVLAARFARLRRLELRAFLSLYRDCLLTGADPVDAFVWRRLYRRAPLMSARSAALLVRELGSPDGQALLSDKQALAERLKAAGVCVPGTHTVRNPLCIEELARVIGPTGLVLKPRYGSGGRNVSAITRTGDGWQIDGLDVDAGRLSEHLTQLSAGHELIVQDRLVSADGLADLSWRGRAPVLRLATSRIPAGPPQLDSALLILPRPGFKPRNFLNGQIYAPIDPDTGMAKGGVVLESPDTMLDFREVDGPRISGRRVPFFAEAVRDALLAMSTVPAVPAIHWDIVLTPMGPVFLEGNGNGNWIIANLAGRYGAQVRPLAATLDRWLETAAPVRRRSALAILRDKWERTGKPVRASGLVLEAVLCLALARLILMVMPFRKVAEHLGDLVAPDDPRAIAAASVAPSANADTAARIGRTLETVARWVPFRAVCLQQALAGHAMLRRRHIPSVLHLGSGRDTDRKFMAHAWLEAAGLPVTGYPPAPQIREVGCFIPATACR